MPDELVETQESAEESVEQVEVEPSTEEETEEEPSEETTEEEEEESQEDEFQEFEFIPEDYDLPEGTTLDEALKMKATPAKSEDAEILARLDAVLKASGIKGGYEALLENQTQMKSPESDFKMPMVSDTIKQYVDKGLIDQESLSYIKPVLNVIDDAIAYRDRLLGYHNNQLMERIQSLEQQLGGVAQASKKTEYNNFIAYTNKIAKGAVRVPPQAELDKIMNKVQGIDSYSEAFAFYSKNDPNYLRKLINNIEKQVTHKGQRYRVKGGIRSQKTVKTETYKPSEFIARDGTVDQAKLRAKIKDPKKRGEILDKIIENSGG